VSDAEIGLELLAAAEVEAAAALWRGLEARAGSVALSCSWDWTATWLRHYGDVVPHRFAVGRRAGEVCGIALVTESTSGGRAPLRPRRVHIGTAGEPPGEGIYVECNRLLAAPGADVGFAAALMRALVAERAWDELALDGFDADQADALIGAEPRFHVRREPSPIVDLRLARGSEDALELLRKSVRQRVRRALRGLGDVSTEWAQGEEAALQVLDELVELHQRRWQAAGQPGAFAAARVRDFHRDLVRTLLPRESAMLFRASCDAGTIGCLYGFLDRGRLLFYQSGFGEFEDPRLKPGLVSHALCLQACLDRGIDEYDFLAGDSRYKRELANGERTLVWAVAARPTPRVALARARRKAAAAARGVQLRLASGAGRGPST
jgi:CelD/BcsL family acetyltransferase involved in cellulose biosynthesis